MPELPEVETVARQLQVELCGRAIEKVTVLWERTVDRPDVPSFQGRLTGAVIVRVGRRGKFITMALNTGQSLLTHLRMTGAFLLLPRNADPGAEDYARVRARLDDGRWLIFADTRKFGRMYLVDNPQEVVGDLGPEPLEASFTPERFGEMLARRRGRIKPLLLNQSFIAGLGNIYADEALWRAGVHPLRTADSLTREEVNLLHAGIVSLLRQAIGEGGTSLRDNQYRQPDGAGGGYQELLAVYGRDGNPCPRCGETIERMVVGQRGTHFCPGCQPSS
jgi:formamidopyrimidine-DNA glycosylase